MKPAFIVTSAINTKFGVFSAEERLAQTLDTIKSIRIRVPDPVIFLVEMAAEPLTKEQKDILQASVDAVVDCSADGSVKEIYTSDNWDIVKNLTEILCFGETLPLIEQYVGNCDRIFKVSGRYLLNENFLPNAYDAYPDKMVFAKRRTSQFSPQTTSGVTEQYMSRCWSFPTSELHSVSQMFKEMRNTMVDCIQSGGYIDIEHLLFSKVDQTKVVELDTIGVEGNIGPNGNFVKD